jgi:hypothetical protein
VGDEGIPPHVAAFIAEQVDSVMQLELLLLLAARPDRAPVPADLAGELRIDAVWVEGQLRAMAGSGLLQVTDGAPPQFAYRPRTADLARTVADLARAYADRRVTVIGLIFSKPVDKLRTFADAFRLRPDRSDRSDRADRTDRPDRKDRPDG